MSSRSRSGSRSGEGSSRGQIETVLTQPWGVTWRKALVSLPRAVPNLALHFTSPEGPKPLVTKLHSRRHHKIPVYVFIPPSPPLDTHNSPPTTVPKLPVLIDFHGGSFILGSCQEQAPFCAKMCRELNCLVISVDYRMGPAAKFPAAIHDSEDVVKAVMKESAPGYQKLRNAINHFLKEEGRPLVDLNTDRIAFSGFSSGGNIALNMALNIKPPQIEEAWPCPLPAHHRTTIPLLLFYPSFDARQLPAERPRPPGMGDAPKGFFKSLHIESELMPTYLPRDQAAHPRASPGLVEMTNGGLHPKAKMMLVLPELDTLSEQSGIWIEKVIKEGRKDDLQVEKYPGMLHGWTQFPDSMIFDQKARETKSDAHRKAVEFLRCHWELV